MVHSSGAPAGRPHGPCPPDAVEAGGEARSTSGSAMTRPSASRTTARSRTCGERDEPLVGGVRPGDAVVEQHVLGRRRQRVMSKSRSRHRWSRRATIGCRPRTSVVLDEVPPSPAGRKVTYGDRAVAAGGAHRDRAPAATSGGERERRRPGPQGRGARLRVLRRPRATPGRGRRRPSWPARRRADQLVAACRPRSLPGSSSSNVPMVDTTWRRAVVEHVVGDDDRGRRRSPARSRPCSS